MLKQAALSGIRDGEVAIVMPTEFLAKSVERRRAEVEEVLTRFLGQPTRLAISVGAAPDGAGQGAPDGSGPPPTPASIAAAEAAEKQARSARVRDAARNHPNIREATRILDGGVEKIEEL
jgi:hypothetical protein